MAEAEPPEALSPDKTAIPAGDFADWLTPWRFALLLLLLILAAFPELVFGAKTFLFRDYSLFGYPLAHYHRECFWRGEIPLWNPLNNSGIPFVAQWNTMVFYPLSLVYLLLPMPWSLGWFCLLHLFLGGLGMYYLAWRWTANRLGASVAGIAFAFSGLTLACLIWPNNIAALGLLPWVCLTVERAWNEGGRAIPKAILVGATQMLSGAPEVILFTWVLIGAIYFSQMWSAHQRRWQLSIRLGLVLFLVACLAAVQLLPFLDLLHHSHREANVADTGTTSWSMPPWGWANFFVPLFRMTKSSMGVFLQPSQGWTSSYYLGIGVLMLALVAIWRVRREPVWALGSLLGLSAILALGDAGHLYKWLHQVFPQMGFMRYPVKLIILAASVTPLLAGFAVARWHVSASERGIPIPPSEAKATQQLQLTTVVSAAIGLLLIAAILWFSVRFPGENEHTGTTLINGLTRAVILLGVPALLFAAARAARPSWRSSFQGGLLLLLWLDLISHSPNQNPVVEARAYQISVPALEEMTPRPTPGHSRAALSWRTLDRFQHTLTSNSFDNLLGVRMGLYDNCNLLDGVPKIDGFYSLFIPQEQQVRFRIFPSTNSIRPALADFLGVSQISSDERFLEWQSRKTWMPLITSGQTPEFRAADQTVESMCSPQFDPRKVVFLPLEARSRVKLTNAVAAKILNQTFSADRIVFEVEASAPAVIVIAQTYYHLWTARVDRVPTSLWRANHAFQAIQVTAGHHRVELAYEDTNFRAGAMISAATLLACLGFLMPGSRASRS